MSTISPMHTKISTLQQNLSNQDILLSDLEKGIDRLDVFANEINNEAKQQEKLIENFDNNITNTTEKINLITNMTDKLIKNSGGKCRLAIIVVLTIIFFILLMVLIFVFFYHHNIFLL